MKEPLTKTQNSLLGQMREVLSKHPECKYATFDMMEVSLLDNRIAILSLRLTPVPENAK